MIPTFTTQRLLLRPAELKDAESYQANFNDYEVIRHLSDQVPWPFPDNGVADFLSQHILPHQGIDRWLWVICLPEKPDDVIGAVDLWLEGKPEHRGFWLAKSHWGSGYMTEAVKPVMDYAFDQLGFERLVFAHAVGNKRSRRVKEKTGARYIETQPARFVDPEYTAHEIWALEKAAWQAFCDQ